MTPALLLPQGITAQALHSGLEVCERVAAKDHSNLYLMCQFLEDRARYYAFIAMYAVMRLIDDFVDNIPDKARLPSEAKTAIRSMLDAWEKRIRGAYAGEPSNDPIDVALSASVLTFPVELQLWLNFIDAMRLDVDHPRFKDFPEFLTYCEGATVAPTAIGAYLLMASREADGRYLLRDFDYKTCGRELGLFAYIAHILRDVREDMAVGETGLVYLAEADLAAHGLTEFSLRNMLVHGRGDYRWCALVRDLCGRARQMELKGTAMVEERYASMSPDCAYIGCLIITTYSELLRRIEENPDAVLGGDPIIGAADKALLGAAAAKKTSYPLTKVIKSMHGPSG